MARSDYTKEEVAQKGKAIYEETLRFRLEEGNVGKLLVINVENGEYELADDEEGSMAATDHLHARQPGAALFGLRIGHAASTFIGFAPETVAGR